MPVDDLDNCPEAIGWHQEDRDGRCRWCGRRLGPPQPRPRAGTAISVLTQAYNYFFNPDFGAHKDDLY